MHDAQCERNTEEGAWQTTWDMCHCRERALEVIVERVATVGPQMLAACDELLTEFISKKRAANWCVINTAMVAMGKLLADLPAARAKAVEESLAGEQARCAAAEEREREAVEHIRALEAIVERVAKVAYENRHMDEILVRIYKIATSAKEVKG